MIIYGALSGCACTFTTPSWSPLITGPRRRETEELVRRIVERRGSACRQERKGKMRKRKMYGTHTHVHTSAWTAGGILLHPNHKCEVLDMRSSIGPRNCTKPLWHIFVHVCVCVLR